jgi:diguanylate cyclase (GGDEF)-like protein/PAS domain S-box-containing protein
MQTSVVADAEVHGTFLDSPNRRWSMRTMLLWMALVCWLPAVMGASALFFQKYQDGRAQLQKNTLLTTRALAQVVDNRLLVIQNAAQALATSGYLATKDFAAFHRQAQEFLKTTGLGIAVVLSDNTGQQLLNTLSAYGTPLPHHGNPAHIAGVVATGQPDISNFFFGQVARRPLISVSVPVRFGAQVEYVLSISLALDKFSQILSRQHLPADWVAGVFDASGTAIARTLAPERFVGQKTSPVLLQRMLAMPEDAFNATTLEGIATLTIFSRAPVSNWSVAIGIPRQSLEAELMGDLKLLGLGAALLLGLSLGLAWVVAGRMSHSMEALRSVAHTLGKGERVVVPQVHLREVHEVVQTMANAAKLLQDRSYALESSNHALMAHEAELEEAQRIAKIGSWSWDARTDATVASTEMCRIFGLYDIPSFAQQDGVMFLHPAWLELHQARLEVLQTGVGYNLELPALHGDGSPFWVNSRSEVVRDSDGAVVGLRGMVQDITERKQLETIAQSERFIRTITNAMPSLVAYWDKDLRCRFANQAYLEWFGKAPEEVIGGTMMQLLGASLFTLNEPYIRAALGGEKQQFERTLTKADDSIGYTLGNYIPDIDGQGIVAGFYVLVTDVTPLKQAQAELQLAATVYQNTAEAIMVTDAHGIILSVNPAFTEITGYPAQEAIGQSPRLLRSNRHEQEFHAGLWRQITETGQWKGEIWNRRKNGEIFLEWQTITRIAGSDKDSSRYVSVFHDITESWQKNEHTKHLAFHDALTDLPNRSLLMERLERQISIKEREPRCLAVLFLDLDRFKFVNDTLGHAIGDDLLIAVAQKLQALVRQSDTVARLGGDEFVIMLDNPASREEVVQIAKRIIAVINEPVTFHGKIAQVGTSIGIARYPEDGATAAELLKSADMAMYQAKHAGKNTYRFWSLENNGT